MKRIIFCLLCILPSIASIAQPPARRAAAQQQKEESKEVHTASQYREFPTALPMPDDVAWRRDLYRTLDLTKDQNATLYYPTVPEADKMNLFTYIFKLILRKEIKAYDYDLSGNENFSEKKVVSAKDLMTRYHIFFESKGDKVKVNDADLPSEDVKTFFIKESTYYNQHTSEVHTQVMALCPVLTRAQDDFGGESTRYPMFWVKYSDVAPFLAKLMLMGSNLNNASMISADDYFTMNLYKGDIYKVTNLQDRILQKDFTTDSSLNKKRLLIEKELSDFEKQLWRGDSIPPQPKDTTAVPEKKSRTVSSRRTSVPSRRSTSSSASKQASASQKRSHTPTTKTKSSATYSVRKQRH